MHSQMPNGYYCEDLIVYGGLNRGCQVTQGFEIFTPDLRHASKRRPSGGAQRIDAAPFGDIRSQADSIPLEGR